MEDFNRIYVLRFLAWILSRLLFRIRTRRYCGLHRTKSIIVKQLFLCTLELIFFSFIFTKIRRFIRPIFSKSQSSVYFYGFVSWFCTLVTVSYVAGPCELRSMREGIAFLTWTSLPSDYIFMKQL